MRKKPYHITDRKVVVDYSSIYCDTTAGLLNSEIFSIITHRFVHRLAKKAAASYDFLSSGFPGKSPDAMAQGLIHVFRLLATHNWSEIIAIAPEYRGILEDRVKLIGLKDDLYNFWLRLERISFMEVPPRDTDIDSDLHYSQFVKANEDLKNLVLQTQRRISVNLMGSPRVFRQLPSFSNLSMLVRKIEWDCPRKLDFLRHVPFVRNTLIFPPLILYPASNTRKGSFGPVKSIPPAAKLNVDPGEWFCFPAKVGDLLGFLYFHRELSSLALSMSNLFEIASKDEIKGKRPDIVGLFGVDPAALPQKTGYLHMKEAGIHLGLTARLEELEYFGYFKKMTLTLHNLAAMKKGHLPVHGAMVNVRLKGGGEANVVIIGDSGAGKSETLEALRTLAEEHIQGMEIIFDDMGSLRIGKDGKARGYGTETGAFVRLDDLSPGYAYEQIERSVFMNPHMKNARLAIPVTDYTHVVKGYPVDYILYANNYDPLDAHTPALEFFSAPAEALKVFSRGARLAKGTTDETGMVSTYFANPFGAPQERAVHARIAEKTFAALFRAGARVGQIRTRLGINGFEMEGPRAASLALFDAIRRKE